MSNIEIEGIKIPLCYNVKAMNDIEAEFGGDFKNLTDWIGDSKISTGEKMRRTSTLIAHLANGAVLKNNQEIVLGLKDGEKKPFYEKKFFEAIINPLKLPEYMSAVYQELSDSTQVSVPDNVNMKPEDEELAEIEAEKNQ